MSERKIASSPTTHTISSITLSWAYTTQDKQARMNTVKIFFIMYFSISYQSRFRIKLDVTAPDCIII
jgi:hypothetical protein